MAKSSYRYVCRICSGMDIYINQQCWLDQEFDFVEQDYEADPTCFYCCDCEDEVDVELVLIETELEDEICE